MSRSIVEATTGLQLRKHSLKAPARRIPSQDVDAVEMTPEMKASVLFDMACIRFGEKNLTLALTCGVSESLVIRWRNPHQRELPSIGQVFALGPEFLRLFKAEQSRHFKWGTTALLDVVKAVGELAEEIA